MNKTVTLHSPLKQDVEFALCFRIQTNKAFFRSSRKMNSILFVFFITTARTWSRCYPTSIEKNGTIPARLFSFKREKCSNSLQNKSPINCRLLSLLKQKTLTANSFWNKLTSINIHLL